MTADDLLTPYGSDEVSVPYMYTYIYAYIVCVLFVRPLNEAIAIRGDI